MSSSNLRTFSDLTSGRQSLDKVISSRTWANWAGASKSLGLCGIPGARPRSSPNRSLAGRLSVQAETCGNYRNETMKICGVAHKEGTPFGSSKTTHVARGNNSNSCLGWLQNGKPQPGHCLVCLMGRPRTRREKAWSKLSRSSPCHCLRFPFWTTSRKRSNRICCNPVLFCRPAAPGGSGRGRERRRRRRQRAPEPRAGGGKPLVQKPNQTYKCCGLF